MVPAGRGQQMIPCFVLVPKRDYTLDDDWHAMGLCGTGSKTIVCSEIFVPRHRVLNFVAVTAGRTPGGDHHAAALYRMPMLSCLPMSITMPPLGMLEGAVDDFREATGARKVRGAIVSAEKTVADHEAVQSCFAEASVSLDAAKLLVRRDIEEVYRVASAGQDVPESMRIRNRLSQAYVVKLAVNAIAGLLDAAGGASVYLDSNIQRVWRDINTAARHIAFNWGAVSTMYGQHTLGRPLTSTVGY